MPSEKVLQEKKEIVASLTSKLSHSMAGVLVDYKGINVADDTKLRKELRESGVEYAVVKNTLLRFAAKEAGFDALTDVLEGTTALAVCQNDAVAAARILVKYADGSKGKFAVKAGFVDGRPIDKSEVEALAKLPPKEVLIAQVLGGLNAPISGFAGVLNGVLRSLVIVLNGVAEKKSA